MAGTTRLELATSAVTGQRSNRLNYVPAEKLLDGGRSRDLNRGPSGCKPDALTAELTALHCRFYDLRGEIARRKTRNFEIVHDLSVSVAFYTA